MRYDPKFYNHKNVYFPAWVEQIFSAKDPAYHTPDLLAEAVRKRGGLIQNNHPFIYGDNETRDQWEYAPHHGTIIVNTEMGPDTSHYKGKTYQLNWEQGLREFLDKVRNAGGMLHVSLDVDFLDPSIAPAVGTTVPGGTTFREAHLVMELLHESGLVTSLDLVELNPFLDERGRTAKLMVELVGSLMGRKVFDRPTRSY